MDTRCVFETHVKVCHQWGDVLRGRQPSVDEVTQIEEAYKQETVTTRAAVYPTPRIMVTSPCFANVGRRIVKLYLFDATVKVIATQTTEVMDVC